MAVDELIADFGAALQFEAKRITGLSALVSLPGQLLRNQARIDIKQALDWSVERNRRLLSALAALEQLREHRYPDRFPHIIGSDIKDELANLVGDIADAAAEFEEPPEAVLAVSDELPLA